MTRKTIIAVVGVGVVLIGLMNSPGRLVLERSSLDANQNPVVVKRGDRTVISTKLPSKIWLPPGRYTVFADSQSVGSVKIRPLKITSLIINTAATEYPPPVDQVFPQLSLPYSGDGFVIAGRYADTSAGRGLVAIIITLYPQLASTEEASLQEAEIRLLTEAAKKYLKDSNVPDSLPVTINK